MKILKFIQAIKDGKVNFNWHGHNSHRKNVERNGTPLDQFEIRDAVERLEKRINFIFEREKTPSQDPEDIRLKMHECYKSTANRLREKDIEFPEHYFVTGELEYHCFNCGERHLRLVAKSPTEIEVMRCTYPPATKDENWPKPIIDNDPCIFADGVPPIETEIDVPTGKLVFVNFFKNYKEHDPEDKYSDEYSLNHARGLLNLSNHFAKQNIGFGQMGNMSVGIYQHPKNKGSILIANTNNPSKDYFYKKGEVGYNEWKAECKEFDKKLGEYKLRGEVDCEVWRWMCCDASIIGKENWKPNDYSREQVIVTVPKGRYKIRHMYRSSTEHSEIVYSTVQKI